MSLTKITAIFFDLDGTLMATALDIHTAISQVLKEYNLPLISKEHVELHASNGMRSIAKDIFTKCPTQITQDNFIKKAFENYHKTIKNECRTTLWTGIPQLLTAIEQQKIKWGIVTNKPKSYTNCLVAHHNLAQRAIAIICPEDVAKKKPDPEPLLKAANIAEVNAANCIYIGDHKRDIIAGNSAKMTTIAAAYGYLEPNTDPYLWQANHVAFSVLEILNWFKQNNWSIK